jgi:hypothetical protein
MRPPHPAALAWLLLVVGPACAQAPQDVGTGGSCSRTTQCAPGLACVEGMCSDDLDGLGGTVPSLDAAVAVPEAGATDAGAPPQG